MTYTEYIKSLLTLYQPGTPIYIANIADKLAKEFQLASKEATAATSVAIKRMMDNGTVTDLRFFQKGIYYRTIVTPFGEKGINKAQLIADKYILPDKGYETGLFLLHRMGLTTQMPREYVIATNLAKECARTDKRLGITIRPPKVAVNAENKAYLQILDVLELIEKAPIDAERPYEKIATHIQSSHLQYDRLLFLADNYYNHKTIIQLAHTAGKGIVI